MAISDEVLIKIRVSHKKAQQALRATTGRINLFSRSIGLAARSVKKLGGSILSMRNIVIAFLAIGALKKITDSAIAFETALINVGTLVDTTKISLSFFETALLDLSKEVRIMPTEVVEAFYQAISAGAKIGSEALEVTRVGATLATAGLSNMKQAVDVLTDVLNAYGLETSQAIGISDIMFKTVELGKITIEELTQSFGLLIPVASSMGIGLEEVSAAVATLTKGSFRAPIAVTALNTAMIGLIKSEKKFKAAGVDILDVIGQRGLTGALGVLKILTKGNISELRNFIQDQKGLRAVAALTGNQWEEYNRILKKTSNATGASETALNKQRKAMGSILKELKVNLTATFIEIGTKFFPILEDMAKKINELMPDIKRFGITFASTISALPTITRLVFNKIKEIWTKTFQDKTGIDIFIDSLVIAFKFIIKAFTFTMQALAPIAIEAAKVVGNPIEAVFGNIAEQARFNFDKIAQQVEVQSLKLIVKIARDKALQDRFDAEKAKNVVVQEERLAAAIAKKIEPVRTVEIALAELIKKTNKSMEKSFDDLEVKILEVKDSLKSKAVNLSETFGLGKLITDIDAAIDKIKNMNNIREKFPVGGGGGGFAVNDPFGANIRQGAGREPFFQLQKDFAPPERPISSFINDSDFLTIKAWKDAFISANESIGKSFKSMKKSFPLDFMTGITDAFSTSLIQMAQAGKLSSRDLIRSMQAAASGQIAAIAAQAAIYAVWQVALGFGDLAQGNVPAAGLHFTSAAKAAAVSGLAIGAAVAIAPRSNAPRQLSEREQIIQSFEDSKRRDRITQDLRDEGILPKLPSERQVVDRSLLSTDGSPRIQQDTADVGSIESSKTVIVNFKVNTTSLELAEDSEVTRLVRNQIIPELALAQKDFA